MSSSGSSIPPQSALNSSQEAGLSRTYDFADFSLDSKSGELLKGGIPVEVAPKVLATLKILIEGAGQVITKDELMARVWPETFVEDANLTQNVFVLRKLLGKESIETVPKVGYRFVLPVTVRASASMTPRGPASLPLLPRLRRTALLIYGLVALLLAILVVGRVTASRRSLSSTLATSWQRLVLTPIAVENNPEQAAISPDGKYLAFAAAEKGQHRLWLRQVQTAGTVPITSPSPERYLALTFAPDSASIYYVTSAKGTASALFRIPLLGGPPERILSGIDSAVAFAHHQAQIAFVRRDAASGQDQLLTADLDGSNQRVVLTRSRPEFFTPQGGPAWSPDDREIACAAGTFVDGLHNGVLAVDTRTAGTRWLSSRRWAIAGRSAWLPDGSGVLVSAAENASLPLSQLWIVSTRSDQTWKLTNDISSYDDLTMTGDSTRFSVLRTEGTADLWIAPAQPTAIPRRIATGPYDLGAADLSWAPDGSLFYRSLESGTPEVWKIAGDPSAKQRIAGSDVAQFSVSPDGANILYSGYSSSKPGIWRIDPYGRNPKRLTTGYADQTPQESPDGRWVVFIGMEDAVLRLWRVPVAGGTPSRLSDRFSYPPALSPDGKYVASFSRPAGSGDLQLTILPSNGGLPVHTFSAPRTAQPLVRWSSDSTSVAYVDTQGDVSNLVRQPLDGSSPTLLTSFHEGRIFGFDWSRTDQLALVRGTTKTQIVVISNPK